MKSISFKNFRRFADFPEFKFGDITILVGGNNAGKSTLVKALILLIDNMKELKYRVDTVFDCGRPVFSFDMDHIHQLNLGTLGRALRNGSDPMNDNLEFTATVGNFKITFYAGNGSHNLNSPTVPVNVEIEDLKHNIVFRNSWAGYMSVIFRGYEDENNIKITDINDKISELEKIIEASEDLAEIADLNDKIEKLHIAKIALQDKTNNNSNIGIATVTATDYINIIADSDFSIPANPLARMVYQWVAYQITKIGIKGYYGVQSHEEALEKVKNSTYLTDLAEGKGSSDPYEDTIMDMLDGIVTKDDHIINHQLLDDKVSLLREIAADLNITLNRLNDFDEVYYIQAHAVTQRVIYSIDNRNDYMASVLHRFSRENILKGTKADLFLCKWIKEFGIGLDYKISAIEGEGYTVEIETSQGIWQHLADLGMGSNQLMTLLIELATLIRVKGNRQYPLIIIEEPEQNLHPKVQSLLAKLFYELNTNRGFKFLIETHSEYLIRHSQVLVAEMNIENEEELQKLNPFKVYYFPKDRVPYDMVYRPDGRFSEEFDSGFFDEASNLAIKLF